MLRYPKNYPDHLGTYIKAGRVMLISSRPRTLVIRRKWRYTDEMTNRQIESSYIAAFSLPRAVNTVLPSQRHNRHEQTSSYSNSYRWIRARHHIPKTWAAPFIFFSGHNWGDEAILLSISARSITTKPGFRLLTRALRILNLIARKCEGIRLFPYFICFVLLLSGQQ